jgi:flagellar motility protein MotE (MotC chaperone)
MTARIVVITIVLACWLPSSLPAQLVPDEQITSVEKRRILVSIEAEYDKLVEREAGIASREMELKTLVAEVDKKLVAMQELRQELLKLLAGKKQEEGRRLSQLSAIYEKMEPQKAAALIGKLEQRQAVDLLLGIKEKIAGKILDNLDPKTAIELSRSFNKIPVQDKSGY